MQRQAASSDLSPQKHCLRRRYLFPTGPIGAVYLAGPSLAWAHGGLGSLEGLAIVYGVLGLLTLAATVWLFNTLALLLTQAPTLSAKRIRVHNWISGIALFVVFGFGMFGTVVFPMFGLLVLVGFAVMAGISAACAGRARRQHEQPSPDAL